MSFLSILIADNSQAPNLPTSSIKVQFDHYGYSA